MIAMIVIEFVIGVHVHVREYLIRLYFLAFVYVVQLNVNDFLHVLFVTTIEIRKYLFRK
jgi:hypothetical protein